MSCTGITKQGMRCKQLVYEGDRCHAHGGALRPQKPVFRCTGRNNKGVPCFAKIPVEGGRCHYHPLEQAEAAE